MAHILNLNMLQRLSALFFILALAGNVLAGVCACLDPKDGGNHSKMSCCVRKKSAQPSMTKKKCCDTPCGQSGETLPQSHSESTIKMPVVVRAAVEKLIAAIAPRLGYSALPPISKRTGNESPPFAKPPILYLRNHAFLI